MASVGPSGLKASAPPPGLKALICDPFFTPQIGDAVGLGPVFGLAFGSAVAPADSGVPSGLNATEDKVPGGGGRKARVE